MIEFKKGKLYEYEFKSSKANFTLMLVYDREINSQNNFKVMHYTYIFGKMRVDYRRGDDFDYHVSTGEMVGKNKLDFYLDTGTYSHYIKYIGNPEDFPEYLL